jgi:hypothetical protein
VVFVGASPARASFNPQKTDADNVQAMSIVSQFLSFFLVFFSLSAGRLSACIATGDKQFLRMRTARRA